MRLALALGTSYWLLACSPAPPVPQDNCLPYSQRAVTLSGKAVARMVTADGAAARNVLLLELDAPICVGAPGATARETNVRQIQLVPQSSFKAAYSLAGLRVTATGPLSAASSGQHHARVIMTLQAIGPK